MGKIVLVEKSINLQNFNNHFRPLNPLQINLKPV